MSFLRSARAPASSSTALSSLALASLLSLVATGQALAQAQAQATVKPDGQFRYALGAGGSYASGNTQASSVNFAAEAVEATADSKLQFDGRALWSRSNGQRTAANAEATAQYNRDLTPRWFELATGDALRDELANLSLRSSVFGGFGRHVVKSDPFNFDLSAALGYTHDKYYDPAIVAGQYRATYGRFEVLLAEESTNKISATTSVHQKLQFFPALRAGGGRRAVFDSGLAVAMTPILNLTVGFTYRYNSQPGEGLKPSDTLFVTGIAVKID